MMQSGAALRQILGKGIAVLLVAAVLAALWQRPHAPWLAVLLAGHAGLQLRWPRLWLATVPGLLPLLDWTPASGWLLWQEFDLFMLGVLAVGYWHWPTQPAGGRLSSWSTSLVAGWVVSWLLALLLGWMAVQGQGWLPGSLGGLNVVRGAKGVVLAIALLPLVAAAWAEREQSLWRYWLPGVNVGLALASLAVIVERWLFPGLDNFASDYRATGLFHEMFAGGAALDVYLVVGGAVCLWGLMRQRTGRWTPLAVLVLGLAVYASLVTFSRGVYLALALTLPLLGWAAHRAGRRAGSRVPVLGVGWLLGGGYAMLLVFHFGGYRTLAAAVLALLAALVLISASGLRRQGVLALAAAVGLWLPLFWLPKGPYLATALAALAGLAGALGHWRQARGAAWLLWASAVGLSIAVPAVAGFWRPDHAWWPVLGWVAYVWVTWLVARRAGWWRDTPQAVVQPVGLVLLLAMAIPVAGNYYMGARFGSTGNDLAGRWSHWSDVAALSREPSAMLAGNGIGRFIDVYYWRNRRAEMPGAVQLDYDQRPYARLIAPRSPQGYGEVVRLSQRVQPAAGALTVQLLARSTAKGVVAVSVCDKWLLYPVNCLYGNTPALGSQWQSVSVVLRGQRATDRLRAIRPAVLALSTNNTNSSGSVEIADVRLEDASGHSLLQNGSFAHGMDYWFYTSDRHHLPWHAKNMWLHVYFEQGAIGLILFSLLGLAAALALLDRMRRGDDSAPMLLAALTGVVAVGLFDSLIDFTRIAVLVFLLLWLSLMRTRPAPAARSGASPH